MPLHVEQLESRLLPFALYNQATGLPYGDLATAVGVREMLELNPSAEALLHPPPLMVRPDPERPGDTAKVQAQVMLIAAPVQQKLTDRGVVVDAYRGAFITDLPRYAGLADVGTGAAGDGGRTYGQVPALTSGAEAVVNEDLVWPTVHEIGHALQYTLPAEWQADWLAVFARIDWSRYPGDGVLDYYRENQGEAYAQSFALWVRNDARLEPAIRDYFDRLFLALPV